MIQGVLIPECKFIKDCVVTKDKNFLGSGNIDKFHALVFKVRNFNTDQVILNLFQDAFSGQYNYFLNSNLGSFRHFTNKEK